MNSCLSQGNYHEVKHRQSHPGFEILSPGPFPTKEIIMLSMSLIFSNVTSGLCGSDNHRVFHSLYFLK